jgi:hypothetical protein
LLKHILGTVPVFLFPGSDSGVLGFLDLLALPQLQEAGDFDDLSMNLSPERRLLGAICSCNWPGELF